MSDDPITDAEGKSQMRDMAVLTRSYYEGLCESGFNKSEALTLTGAWVRGVVAGSSGKGSDG